MTARHATAVASAAVAILAAVAAAFGVFARGDGTFITVESVRGEVYEMATTGVYAYNALQVVAEGVGWDVFTLAVAAPLMLVASWLVARGSFRGLLFASGLFAYFLYMYLEYAVTWALGPLFGLFVVIMATSLAGLIGAGVLLARERLQTRFDERFPRRAWAGLSISMSALLMVMWTGRIAAGLSGAPGGELHGETTMTVQALDLGLVVPISILIAIAAWRRSPVGMAAAAAYAVTFVAMSAAIASMMVSASIATSELQTVPIVVFGVAGAAGLAVLARMYLSATPAVPERGRSSGPPVEMAAAR